MTAQIPVGSIFFKCKHKLPAIFWRVSGALIKPNLVLRWNCKFHFAAEKVGGKIEK